MARYKAYNSRVSAAGGTVYTAPAPSGNLGIVSSAANILETVGHNAIKEQKQNEQIAEKTAFLSVQNKLAQTVGQIDQDIQNGVYSGGVDKYNQAFDAASGQFLQSIRDPEQRGFYEQKLKSIGTRDIININNGSNRGRRQGLANSIGAKHELLSQRFHTMSASDQENALLEVRLDNQELANIGMISQEQADLNFFNFQESRIVEKADISIRGGELEQAKAYIDLNKSNLSGDVYSEKSALIDNAIENERQNFERNYGFLSKYQDPVSRYNMNQNEVDQLSEAMVRSSNVIPGTPEYFNIVNTVATDVGKLPSNFVMFAQNSLFFDPENISAESASQLASVVQAIDTLPPSVQMSLPDDIVARANAFSAISLSKQNNIDAMRTLSTVTGELSKRQVKDFNSAFDEESRETFLGFDLSDRHMVPSEEKARIKQAAMVYHQAGLTAKDASARAYEDFEAKSDMFLAKNTAYPPHLAFVNADKELVQDLTLKAVKPFYKEAFPQGTPKQIDDMVRNTYLRPTNASIRHIKNGNPEKAEWIIFSEFTDSNGFTIPKTFNQTISFTQEEIQRKPSFIDKAISAVQFGSDAYKFINSDIARKMFRESSNADNKKSR